MPYPDPGNLFKKLSSFIEILSIVQEHCPLYPLATGPCLAAGRLIQGPFFISPAPALIRYARGDNLIGQCKNSWLSEDNMQKLL